MLRDTPTWTDTSTFSEVNIGHINQRSNATSVLVQLPDPEHWRHADQQETALEYPAWHHRMVSPYRNALKDEQGCNRQEPTRVSRS